METDAVTDPVEVLERRRNSMGIQTATGCTEKLEDGCIALDRVEGVDRLAVGPGGHGLGEETSEGDDSEHLSYREDPYIWSTELEWKQMTLSASPA